MSKVVDGVVAEILRNLELERTADPYVKASRVTLGAGFLQVAIENRKYLESMTMDQTRSTDEREYASQKLSSLPNF